MNKDFSEFEKQLTSMRIELEATIARLEEEMEDIVTEDEIDDAEDMASLLTDSIDHKSLLIQQRHELKEVEHALEKIHNGAYGICEKSGKPISKARLRIEPQARFTIEKAE